MDLAACERFLGYFRRAAATGWVESDDVPDEQFAMQFIRQHGQSFDWIFLGDVGVMVCQVAAVFAPAAEESSAVFAAIEAHRAATDAISQTSTDEETARACGVQDDAAEGLLAVEPTTLAGVMALLRHVTEHDEARGYGSWPVDLSDPDTLDARGRALVMPFYAWLLRSVQRASSPFSASKR